MLKLGSPVGVEEHHYSELVVSLYIDEVHTSSHIFTCLSPINLYRLEKLFSLVVNLIMTRLYT